MSVLFECVCAPCGQKSEEEAVQMALFSQHVRVGPLEECSWTLSHFFIASHPPFSVSS